MTAGDEGALRRFAAAAPGRLDSWLTRQWPDVSRTRWQALIRGGYVTVNGRVVDRPGIRLSGGEQVGAQVPAPQPAELAPSDIPLRIVYEDGNVLVADKPAGIVVHPSAGHESDTLVQAVLNHAPGLPGVGGERRPGVVHRLDKDTSGLVIFAKHDGAMLELQRQFKARQVKKTYLAIVHGAPPTEEGLIDAPVGRDPRERKRMAVVAEQKGRPARSRFHRIGQLGEYALLLVEPETGRTHQIRVHLAYLGTPVAGDRVYGSRHQPDWLGRQMLHAWRLQLGLTDEPEPRRFEAAIPADFREALVHIGGAAAANSLLAELGRLA
jgi:23S rRNA pseudouridine1911/1915/1917 synthase